MVPKRVSLASQLLWTGAVDNGRIFLNRGYAFLGIDITPVTDQGCPDQQGPSIFSDRDAGWDYSSWGHLGWMQSNTFVPGLFLQDPFAFPPYVVEITP